MTLSEFEQLVGEAIDSLPEQFTKLLSNVEVVVEIWPTPGDLAAAQTEPGTTLFGLYRGIPQTQRGTYQAVLPDKISIFAGPIVQAYGEHFESVRQAVQHTVLHEIGHHFGMSEAEIQNAMK